MILFFNAGNTRDYDDDEEDERKQKVIKLEKKTVSIFELHIIGCMVLFNYTGILCYINWIIICRGSDYSK